MTFLSLPQKEFQKILNLCNQISPKKSDIEVFTYSYIVLKDGFLNLSSINSSLFYNTRIQPQNLDKNAGDLKFLIKTDILTSSVSLISDEIIGLEIDMDKLTLIVQGSKSKHTLRLNLDLLNDFVVPEPNPDDLEAMIEVKAADLQAAGKVALTTVGQPRSVYQPEFLSICFTLRAAASKLTLASSDKYRISRTYMTAKFEHTNESVQAEPTNYLLNPRVVQLLGSILSGTEDVSFAFERSYCHVKFLEHSLTLRYGEGKFPDYEKIIPQSFSCSFLMNTKDCLEGLRQVYLSARANATNKSISLNVMPSSSKIIFSAKTDEGYSSEATVDMANYEGMTESWSQSFNADYLLDYVNTLTTENFLVESNPGKPMVMSPENDRARQLCLVQGLR